MNVLIADDEQIVLSGLQFIIDWKALGFSICGTASDGIETLEKIRLFQPDLVMLDIRMPRLNGIDVVRTAVREQFRGKFIILSGISDFKLAQTAMRYGVDFYLTKPIDEDELTKCVSLVRDQIEKETHSKSHLKQYRDRAREAIIHDLLTGDCDYSRIDVQDLELRATWYQVACYEKYNQEFFYTTWNFAELFRLTNSDRRTYELLELDQRNIVLLKGDFAIGQFEKILQNYSRGTEKGSPFDSVFLTYGRRVARIEDIHFSYEDVASLMNHRFFCSENQHVFGYEELPALTGETYALGHEKAKDFAEHFSGYVQSHNRMLLGESLNSLADYVSRSGASEQEIKLYLIDIYISVKQKIMRLTGAGDIDFPANATVIELISGKYYLYEIMSFLREQFFYWMQTIGRPSGENVMDEILYYIRENYRENLHLETIAPLFGYNSSYLGKVFTRKVGKNFNTYVDEVRIEKAKELLADQSLKIYEVSELVGYSNTDYFHKKFRRYTGTTPAEYRKRLQSE